MSLHPFFEKCSQRFVNKRAYEPPLQVLIPIIAVQQLHLLFWLQVSLFYWCILAMLLMDYGMKREGRIIFIKTTKMKINLFFFIMYSNGRRKSFWKWKFDNSPFSRNFIDNCLSESTQKNETSSFKLHPTYKDKKESMNVWTKQVLHA